MPFNLLTAWKESALPEILSEHKETKTPFVAQTSFQFDIPPKVIFVKDLHSQKQARRYGDLPTVTLKSEEQKIYDQAFAKLSSNQNFYNGKQMLLTGVIYDSTSNILYLEAVRVDYVFLVALEEMKKATVEGSALAHKEFFKTGVLAPFISSDDKISIVTRKDKWNLRSVAAGFLECKDARHSLADLIRETASKEADEEFVHDRDGRRRLDFVGLPFITSVSFRDAIGMGMTPTIEFVAPIRIKQDARFILSVMNQNEASHAHEHVPGSARNVPIDTNGRAMASDFMREKLPGNFLYGPILHACSIKINPEMLVARRIAEISDSRFFPIGMFRPAPQKALTDQSAVEVQDRLTTLCPERPKI